MSRLKISIFLGHPLPFAGAAWVRIAHFAQSWKERGHDVDVVGTFTPTSFRKRGNKIEHGTRIHNLIFVLDSNHPIIFLLNMISSMIAVFFYLIIRKPRICVISVPPGSSGIGAIIACWLSKTRYAIDYRDQWEEFSSSICKSKFCKTFYSLISYISASLYNRAIVISTATTNFQAELTSKNVNRCTLIQNGADISIFHPNLTNIPTKKKFDIIYSGEIGGYYRVDLVVRAIANLTIEDQKNIRFLIAGKGSIDKVLEIAKECNIQDKVEYIGSLSSKEELAKLIANADVGIIPYDDNKLWKNSIPAKFFEYCACGVPVIATAYNDSLLAQLIAKYSVGFTIPPNDIHQLSNALKRIKDDLKFRSDARKQAREMVLKSFDRDITSRKLLGILTHFSK